MADNLNENIRKLADIIRRDFELRRRSLLDRPSADGFPAAGLGGAAGGFLGAIAGMPAQEIDFSNLEAAINELNVGINNLNSTLAGQPTGPVPIVPPPPASTPSSATGPPQPPIGPTTGPPQSPTGPPTGPLPFFQQPPHRIAASLIAGPPLPEQVLTEQLELLHESVVDGITAQITEHIAQQVTQLEQAITQAQQVDPGSVGAYRQNIERLRERYAELAGPFNLTTPFEDLKRSIQPEDNISRELEDLPSEQEPPPSSFGIGPGIMAPTFWNLLPSGAQRAISNFADRVVA